MKTFIELTDFWNPERLEYLDPLEIARIEPHEETETTYQAVTKTIRRFRFINFWRKDVTENVVESSTILTGSIVYMKNAGRTYVSESPMTIIGYAKSALKDTENNHRESRRKSLAMWTETIKSKLEKKAKGVRK